MDPVTGFATTPKRTRADGRPAGLRRWAGIAVLGALGLAVLGSALIAFLGAGNGKGGVELVDEDLANDAAPIGPTPVNSAGSEGKAGAVASLYALVDGQPIQVRNGGVITAADIEVSVLLNPYPPRTQTDVEFTVSRDGQPIDDANVSLSFDMETMDHGPFRLLAIPVGSGAYIAPLTFNMDGDFWLNVAIDAGGNETVLNLGMFVNR